MKKKLRALLCLILCMSACMTCRVDAFFWGSNAACISALLQSIPRPEKEKVIPALMYHHISDDVRNSMVVTPEKLESDLVALKEAGYETLLPAEFIQRYLTGTLPEKPLLLTFDDGYESNYEYLFPLLKKYEMKATIFAIGSTLGRTTMPDQFGTPITPHFTAEQGREMVESGYVSIQPHSYSMHFMRTFPEERVYGIEQMAGETEEEYRTRFENDFRSASYVLEQIGEPVVAYSYPFGLRNDIAEEVLRENGVYLVFMTNDTLTYVDSPDDLMRIQRLNVTNTMSSQIILDRLALLTGQ